MFKVQFADIGEGLTEGKVVDVLVNVGDEVKAGDSLFSVETDKVNADIPAPIGGKIRTILIKPDQEINVGDVVMEIADGSINEVFAKNNEQKSTVTEEENASVVGSTPVSNDLIDRKLVTSSPDVKTQETILISPLARKMAAKNNLDLTKIHGTGTNGRILVADLERSLNGNDQSQPASVAPSSTITNVSSSEPTKNVSPNAPLEWDTIPMNGIRKATVKGMTKSHTEIASFTGIKTIDFSATYALRKELKPFAEAQGIKLTFLAFIVKAVAKALKDFPNINVRGDFENNQILQIHNINIGIAVDTPEGLMVPVIKGADKYSVFELASQISLLAKKARDRKLVLSEMRDATFTITNLGSVGLDFATPIINSPEAAILGVGSMTKTPVFVDDEVVGRYLMPFSITCDHRIIDGADGARFLNKVQEYLDQPLSLLV